MTERPDDTTLNGLPPIHPEQNLLFLLESRPDLKTVVLAPNQLSVRHLRRILSGNRTTLWTAVYTEAAWLEEAILLNLPAEKLPSRILSPGSLLRLIVAILRDETLRLPAFFRSEDGIRAVNRWIQEAAVKGVSLQEQIDVLSHDSGGLPLVLHTLNQRLSNRNWCPRIYVPQLVASISGVPLLPARIIRWETGAHEISRHRAFTRLQELSPSTEFISIIQQLPNAAANLPLAAMHTSGDSAFQQFHDEFSELTACFKRIAGSIQSGGSKPADHAILCPDLEAYRQTAGRLSAEVGIPVYFTSGRPLRALPLTRRFLLLLDVIRGNDEIDTAVQVFGDNLLKPGSYSKIRTAVPPMFRDLGIMSRRWNTRTFSSVKKWLESAPKSTGLAEACLDHIEAIRLNFPAKGVKPLSSWLKNTVIPVLEQQPELGSETAGNLRNALVSSVSQFIAELQLPGLDPEVSFEEAFDEVRRLFGEKSEPVPEMPDAVLFTSPGQLSCFENRHVHLIGLHETAWPAFSPPDFLRIKHAATAHQLFGDPVTENWNAAAHRLAHALFYAKSIFISAPKHASGRQVPLSPLLHRLLPAIRKPETAGSAPLFLHEWSQSQPKPSGLRIDPGTFYQSFRLTRRVYQLRQRSIMGVYDGVLTDDLSARNALHRILRVPEKPLTFSPTRLDTYIGNPHGFFTHYILNVREPDQYAEIIAPEDQGKLIHTITAKFYTDSEEWPLVDPSEEPGRARDKMEWCIDCTFSSEKSTLGVSNRLFVDKLRRDITTTMMAWLKEESERTRNGGYFQNFIPSAFFADLSTETTLELPFDEGSAVSVIIDRIDFSHSPENTFAVIDYKTGNTSGFKTAEVLEGMLSQMLLYGWAVSKKTGRDFNGAFYWGLKPGILHPADTSTAALIPQRFKSSRRGINLDDGQIRNLPDVFMATRFSWIAEAVRNGIFNVPLTGVAYPANAYLSRINPLVQEKRRLEEFRQAAVHHADGRLGSYYCRLKIPVSVSKSIPSHGDVSS